MTACLFATVFAVLAGAAVAQTPFTASQIDQVLTGVRAAAGGPQLDRFVESTSAGSVVQGGAPFVFTSIVDLRNGHYREETRVGPATFLDGYDGEQWTVENGAFSVVSLPAYVADAITQAYLASNAYLRPSQRATIVSGRSDSLDGRAVNVLHVQPAGGSPADLFFDAASNLLVRVVAEQAGGADTTTFSDYQTIQGIPTAMKSVDVNPSGTTTTTTLTTVNYATTLDPAALARPPYASRSNLSAAVSIPFQSDEEGAVGHIVVPVSLDGANGQMIFDSGGGNFLVDTAAQRLGLKTSGDFAIGGVGSKQQMSHIAAVSVVDFGGARLDKQNFVVTQLLYALVHPKQGMVVDGLVGYEYLANYRVTVRYAQRRIDVAPFDAPAPAGGVTLPFKSDGGHVYVSASVDGVSGYFLLDTGNSGGIDLNGPFAQEHKLFANGGLTYVSPGGIGGTVSLTLTAAKNVRLAGLKLDDVPVAIVHTTAGAFATRGVAGNLGAQVLSRFTVVFDYKAETVTFIPNAEANEKFRTDRTGLSLNQTGPGAFDVLGVIPGSPAADAGITASDRITAVNGTPVSSGLGLGNIRPLSTGAVPFTLTVEHAAATRTVTITPRDILPPAQ